MRRGFLVIAATSSFSVVCRRQNIALQFALDKLAIKADLNLSNSSTGTDLAIESAVENATLIDPDASEISDLTLDNSTLKSSVASRSSHADLFEDKNGSSERHDSHWINADTQAPRENTTLTSISDQWKRLFSSGASSNAAPNSSQPAIHSFSSLIGIKHKMSRITGAFSRIFEEMDSKQLCFGLAGGLVLGWCCCCAWQSVAQNKSEAAEQDSDWSPMTSSSSVMKRALTDPARKIKNVGTRVVRMARPPGMHGHGIPGIHLRSHHSDGDREHHRDRDHDSFNRHGDHSGR